MEERKNCDGVYVYMMCVYLGIRVSHISCIFIILDLFLPLRMAAFERDKRLQFFLFFSLSSFECIGATSICVGYEAVNQKNW